MTVETRKLENGLTVYMVPNRQVPLVTLDMWVRAGSADEPSEIAGISHYLEHMLFKGTPRLGVGEYDRRIEELGGYLNAATSGDFTHYYLTVPSENLDAALTDMADVLFNSSLDAEEVESERQVILEEIAMKQDQPIGFLYDEIVGSVYDSGPYENTVIGSEATVSAMTRDQLLEHYQRFYAPENMAFVAVGDFDEQELMAKIQDLFRQKERPYNPWRETTVPTAFSRAQEQVWRRDWQQTYFFFTWPGHGLDGLERIAIDSVLEQILSGGRSSRLIRSLREEKRLATSVAAFGPHYRYPGFWGIYGTCEADALAEVQNEVKAILQSIADDGITPDELRRAKKTLITDHLYELETNTGKSSLIGQSYALLGSPALFTDYPSAIESVDESDVRDLVKSIIAHDMSSFVVRPTDITEGLEETRAP